MKDMVGVETVMIGVEDMTVVEDMKGKGAKGQNGVRNKAEKGKQERYVVMRGYS